MQWVKLGFVVFEQKLFRYRFMPEVFHQNEIESSQHRQGMVNADIRDQHKSMFITQLHPGADFHLHDHGAGFTACDGLRLGSSYLNRISFGIASCLKPSTRIRQSI